MTSLFILQPEDHRPMWYIHTIRNMLRTLSAYELVLSSGLFKGKRQCQKVLMFLLVSLYLKCYATLLSDHVPVFSNSMTSSSESPLTSSPSSTSSGGFGFYARHLLQQYTTERVENNTSNEKTPRADVPIVDKT